MSSLVCLALPSSYLLSYLAFSSTHLLLSLLRQSYRSRQHRPLLSSAQLAGVRKVYAALRPK